MRIFNSQVNVNCDVLHFWLPFLAIKLGYQVAASLAWSGCAIGTQGEAIGSSSLKGIFRSSGKRDHTACIRMADIRVHTGALVRGYIPKFSTLHIFQTLIDEPNKIIEEADRERFRWEDKIYVLIDHFSLFFRLTKNDEKFHPDSDDHLMSNLHREKL